MIGRKYSVISYMLALLAALSFYRASLAFEAGDRAVQTNLPYVARAIQLFHSGGSTAAEFQATPAIDLTESSIMVFLVLLSMLLTASVLVCSWLARIRKEPSHIWAAPAVGSLLVGVYSMHLLYWISASW